MSDPRVRSAFETALETWAAAQSPALPVVYQNASPTDSQQDNIPTTAYVKSWLIPAQDKSLDIGGKHREYSGIFQVDLCMLPGTGHGDVTTLAQSLDNVFDTDTPITSGGLNVWITLPMTEGPPIPSDTHYIVPVYCSYQAHTFKS